MNRGIYVKNLTFLDSIYRIDQVDDRISFLVTGSDLIIHQAFIEKVLEQSKQKRQAVIVIDDSDDTMFEKTVAMRMGYNIKDGMDEKYCLYDMIPINIKKKNLQLREILNIFNYSEEKKSKLYAYFEFISYFERVFYGNASGDIYLDTLRKYSSNIQVDMKLYELLSQGKIDRIQKEYLQARYVEVGGEGADFENAMLLLEPFITGNVISFKANEIMMYSISKFDGDITVKNLIIHLLLNYIREHRREKFVVLILDKGYGERNSIYDFVNHFPSNVELHLFSQDVFTLCTECERGQVFNRFPIRIFGRHASEASCYDISTECGEIDVKKTSYSVTYDRRWRANKPIDILTGNNKQEVYTTATAIREPRYRKEMVSTFHPGTGIAQYKGQTLLFSI